MSKNGEFPNNVVSLVDRLSSEPEENLDEETLRLVEQGRMSEGVQHQMSNYFQAASGMLDVIYLLLQEGNLNNEITRDRLETLTVYCIGELKEAGAFAKEAMNLGKRESEKSEVDLNSSIDGACKFLGSKLRGIEIERRYDRGLPTIEAYPKGLKQVFINIIKNSVEAVGQRPDRRITLTTSIQGKYALVRIDDNGEGMDRDQLENIFTRDSTKSNGNGIGTQYCRLMMKKHGGDIMYTSTKGEGTTAYVMLPLEIEKKADDGVVDIKQASGLNG